MYLRGRTRIVLFLFFEFNRLLFTVKEGSFLPVFYCKNNKLCFIQLFHEIKFRK